MDHFYQNIDGWFDYQDIYKRMVTDAGQDAHFVEVGVHLGKSAAFMAVEIANSGKNIRFDCIDPWDGRSESGHHYKNGFEMFMDNMFPANGHFNVVVGASPEVSAMYPDASLDFVWIDAIHLYDNVKADIEAWLPKVRKGGYIGGHDYSVGHENGIDRAVSELLPGYTVHNGSLVDSWLYHKA